MQVQWLGNACFKIITGNQTRIYLDPWIRDNPGCPLTLEEIKDANYVMVTHGHPGHYGKGDSVTIARQCKCPYVTNHKLAAYLISSSLLADKNTVALRPEIPAQIGDLRVTAFVTGHPAEPHNLKKGPEPAEPNCGYIIESGNLRLLHIGDTVEDSVFTKLGEIDIAMLPLWSKAMADSEDVAISRMVTVIDMLRPRIIIPHYRYEPDIESPEKLGRILKEKQISSTIVKLLPGNSINIIGCTLRVII